MFIGSRKRKGVSICYTFYIRYTIPLNYEATRISISYYNDKC